MGRPTTPTALKEIRGSFKRHPERRKDGEPVPTRGIGPAPEYFCQVQRDIWDEIVGQMYPGVLGEADRLALEIMVTLVYRFRWANGETIQPLMGAELARLTSLLSQFGMTPSDRTKIVVPKGEKKNPFSDL